MGYTVLRSLAYNGRLYQPGSTITDLPEKAQLTRWIKNGVVAKDDAEKPKRGGKPEGGAEGDVPGGAGTGS